jgi:hypothetical protein
MATAWSARGTIVPRASSSCWQECATERHLGRTPAIQLDAVRQGVRIATAQASGRSALPGDLCLCLDQVYGESTLTDLLPTSARTAGRRKAPVVPPELRGPVFALHPDGITQAFERALQRASSKYLEECAEQGRTPDPAFLRNLRFHDLRHEATSRLASRFQLHELAKITGHRDTRMLLRYYHPDMGELAKRLG